jgi:hypothetical protein
MSKKITPANPDTTTEKPETSKAATRKTALGRWGRKSARKASSIRSGH